VSCQHTDILPAIHALTNLCICHYFGINSTSGSVIMAGHQVANTCTGTGLLYCFDIVALAAGRALAVKEPAANYPQFE